MSYSKIFIEVAESLVHQRYPKTTTPTTSTMRRLASRTAPGVVLAPRTCTVAQRAHYATTSPSDEQAIAQKKSQNVEASRQTGSPSASETETVGKAPGAPAQRRKTMAELDEELRLKMEGMSGEGGSAGVEYENGKSEGLKRGVKANMFRVI